MKRDRRTYSGSAQVCRPCCLTVEALSGTGAANWFATSATSAQNSVCISLGELV